MTNSLPFDSRELRRTLGAFATGVTVVTTVAQGGKFEGVTVSSFNSVSLDPPLILWSLARSTPCFEAFQKAAYFAINVLAVDQVSVSEHFASLANDKFADLAMDIGLGGVPLLQNCAATLECRAEAAYPGGDHTIFVGRVERLYHSVREPLIFWDGGYRAVGHSLSRP